MDTNKTQTRLNSDHFHWVGKICGELWVRTYASRWEQKNVLDLVPEEPDEWDEWLESPSEYTVPQRFFFGLIGDGACDRNEAEAFWLRFCKWALVDDNCFQGFVSGAVASAPIQYSCSSEDFELQHKIDKAEICADAWREGANWARRNAKPEHLQALRTMTENRQIPWRQWLQTFSSYSTPDRLYFLIAGDETRNLETSSRFWNQHCPLVFEYEECTVKFVCGAMNIEMSSLIAPGVLTD